jgi:predicted anti-sigma-YlaC factor YlaD
MPGDTRILVPVNVSAALESFARVMAVAAVGGALSACGTINTLAVKGVASTLSEGGDTVTSHNDPDLIAEAMPFALVLHESLLSSVPRHEPLLTTTCGLYTQYAFGFVAVDAERLQRDDYEQSKALNERAFKLAERGKQYCWRGLEVKFQGIGEALRKEPARALARTRKEHVELLYWSAASLGAAISTGGLDHPELLIEWPVVRALAERALALDETWSAGAIPELLITVESQGEALGGSEERARRYFARAVEIQQGLSPGPYVALATGIVKGKQDRAEFVKLMDQALAIDPDKDPGRRLVTLITQRRAKALLERVDDLFLEAERRPE